MAGVFGTHAPFAEREQRGYRWFDPGVQGPNVAALPQVGTLISRQEQPWHPGSSFQTGVQGPNVMAPVTQVAIGVQEQPWHPRSSLLPGVQGPNVMTPVTRVAVTKLEVPFHPGPSVLAGVQGPNVMPANTLVVLTRQEMPWHPASFVQAGGWFTAVRPSPSVLLTKQEQPWHPGPAALAGVQGPNVAVPPQVGAVITRQEAPNEWLVGRGTLSIGVQGPNVAPLPMVGTILVRQEQPFHPAPSVLAGIQGPSVAALPMVGVVLTKQEQPSHPGSLLLASLRTPLLVQGYTILGRQEQPFHPLPSFVAGVATKLLPPIVPPPLLTRQEQPWHPGPFTLRGIFAQQPVSPVTRQVQTRQEQPWHPTGFFIPISQFLRIVAPQALPLLTKQEQPWHPGPSFWRGIDGPNYAPAPQVRTWTIGTMEQPWHPGSFTLRGRFQQQPVAPVTRAVITRLEIPFHPTGWLQDAVQHFRVVAPPIAGRMAVTRLEWPTAHPLPRVFPGLPPLFIPSALTQFKPRPYPQEDMPNEREHRRHLARILGLTMKGQLNATVGVTLQPNATQTVITDPRLSMQTSAHFAPTTANAAAELASGQMFWVPQAGTLTITHRNSAQTDRIYIVSLIG